MDKNHLKCDVIDGSVADGARQPILYSFVSDKHPGYEVFCQHETMHYEKMNKSVVNTIFFYFEPDDNKEANFIDETLTFTLQIAKI